MNKNEENRREEGATQTSGKQCETLASTPTNWDEAELEPRSAPSP